MSRFGSNLGYVDELYARFLEDPSSVSDAWREFFADYRPAPGGPSAGAPRPDEDRPTAPEGAEPLRGISARIVENMVTSLDVPTATSVRTVPVKLLEENRRLLNEHQATVSGPKISFTHLLAWAIVRGLERFPGLNAGFTEVEGEPARLPRTEVALGLAIDLERDGRRILLVPNIKNAAEMDFPAFVARYNDLVLRARSNRLTVDEFQGTTVTLTNPGMLGTAMSVPRLMAGQGAIFGIGNIGYPAAYRGMSPDVIAALGISRIMTITSTYDHRIVQGAESGAFLKTVEDLLLGGDAFYERIFQQSGVPFEPLTWSGDLNPPGFGAAAGTELQEKQAGVSRLIRAHRVRGHLLADLDPLGYDPGHHEELELSSYGLTVWDLDRSFSVQDLGGESGMMPLRSILDILRQTYTRHVGVEFLHIPDPEPRVWLQNRMESTRNADPVDLEVQKQILRKLNAAEAFEKFLHTTYIGHKRFSLEGAEALIPALDALLTAAGEAGTEHAVIGMAHRGRLNVLANTIGMSYERIFRRFEGDLDPGAPHGSGDVIYHLGFEGEHPCGDDRSVHLTLASNPSHLEAVDPVVEGMARALQDRLHDRERRRVLPILIHGDAAFAGQGVVAETLNLSQLAGYRTGGTVHVIVNNQIGFTTGPRDARSSLYPTDVAKMARAPILHVNGDFPEDVVRAVRLALEFRNRFGRDVVVDMVCYRRWGHNEADDPSFTNPMMYARIEHHRSVRKLYTERLLRRGDLDPATAESALDDFRSRLRTVHDEVKALGRDAVAPPEDDEDDRARPRPAPETGVPEATLRKVIEGLDRLPDRYEAHPKLQRQLARRRERFDAGEIDWAMGEALAFGSLVIEGTPVRLSGEDSGRGTFSHRHAILYDHRDGTPYVPLAILDPDQAPFWVYDSLLSEFAVLGFEYGYSVQYPDALVLWEAQFGDFNNGAQVIIDQFLASAEDKWGQQSSLVMLLPHGSEGQGPEHSSARQERFLQLCAGGNLQVANPTTPAQYFHLLRGQARAERATPLVVLTPKSLLRLPPCISTPADLETGRFRDVLDDPTGPDPERVRRVVLCNGKVYYDLRDHASKENIDDVAIVRIERLYPLPIEELAAVLERYPGAADVVWAQEEPRNMGAWTFIHERLSRALPKVGRTLGYAGRPRAASPAPGSARLHQAAQDRLVRDALEDR